MPVFSKELNCDFDTLGISLAKMDGNYFGLWDKLLSGFDIPHTAMCDKDALMHIDRSIKCKEGKVMTSPVFCSLTEANHLTNEEEKKISEVQSKIIQVKRKKIYPDELFDELKTIAKKHNVYILSSDFEGVLKEKGYSDLLKKACSISRSKAIQGRFVAEEILAKGAEIPSEFITVINAVKKLASASSD